METLLPFEKRDFKIHVKKNAVSNPAYGKKPEERNVAELINYGIINLNKFSGPSSHQISDYVQKILGIEKAGHSGTLDPHVTGVLPIALDKATRIVEVLLKAGKEYVALMHIHALVDEKKIQEAVNGEFLGKIQQLPPIRSAVKRQLRQREIYYLQILEVEGQDVLFKVGCEAGTYIRKLIHDLGLKLGCGAHMVQLVRTKAGPFTDKNWKSLHDLKDAYEFWKEGDEKEIRKVILPMEKAVEHLPKIWVMDNCVDTLCHGADLSVPGVAKYHEFNRDETLAIMTLKDELISLGIALEHSNSIRKKERGKIVKNHKVFMERKIYPRFKNG